MSGWFALHRTDGAPIDDALAERMLSTLRARGPHGEALFRAPGVVLGMTILDTLDRAPLARGPERHGPLVGVGQVRVDARDEVVAALGIPREQAAALSDLALMLRGIEKYGDDVIGRIGGEMSGCAWDERTRDLFLFRDGFGVRQLFYAEREGWLIASNSLSAVRAHPSVTSELDDDAILDFLLFEFIIEPRITAFRDVRRIEGGHVARVDARGVSPSRAWQLQCPPVVRTTDHRELGRAWVGALGCAVQERTGASTSILLTGGIDSSAIASLASVRGPARRGLTTITAVSSETDGGDGRMAAECARWLSLPHVTASGATARGEGAFATAPLRAPLPVHDPLGTGPEAFWHRASTLGPVALHGHGGDEIWRAPTLFQLARTTSAASAMRHALTALRARVRPEVGSGVIARWRRPAPVGELPRWISSTMRPRAAARLAAGDARLAALPREGPRSVSLWWLTSPQWSQGFLDLDAAALALPLEVRFPMLARAVVASALRVPPFPGTVQKCAARRALTGLLPPSVLSRPKQATPVTALSEAKRASRDVGQPRSTRLESYVDTRALQPEALAVLRDDQWWVRTRPWSLGRWLDGLPA